MAISLKQVSITTSILILFVLYYDFCVLNKYSMESSAVIGISALMTFNIVRYFSKKIQKMFWLLILTYVSVLCTAMAFFYILLIFSFGFGYTGREAPLNHLFAIILTLTLIIVTILEFNRALNKKG